MFPCLEAEHTTAWLAAAARDCGRRALRTRFRRLGESGKGLHFSNTAEPEKEIVLPTAHVVLDVGALIVTVGRPTAIVTESVSEAPNGSVTLSEAT